MEQKYYLGLDMGTSSLGWAVTDQNYHLLRAKGKDLWGVRLFQEANVSASRRTNRVSRRRLQREKARIGFVRAVFADAINEVDPGFYQRLEDSKYYPEDKAEHQKYALFTGERFTDKEYYEKYPTIFHLRSDLLKASEPRDVRLVYLAVLNIFKHRGHFLNANLSDEKTNGFEHIYAQIAERIEKFPSNPKFEYLKEILSSNKGTKSQKAEQMIAALHFNKKDPEAEMAKMVCGLKAVLPKAFPDCYFDEEHTKYSVSFRDGNYEEKETEMQEFLDEETFEIVQLLKQMHDWGLLANIMNGEEYLSDARVASYEKHASDLKILKDLYKQYGCGSYNKMFRVMEDHNYSAYVGSVNSDKERGKERRGAKGNRDDFYKRIKNDLKKMLEKASDDARISYVLDEIEKETFLPKQLTFSNGVIPYQVHFRELKQILENAETYLPFLKEVDETGLSNTEKILRLFSFQIPYYIGPLYNDGNPAHNAWVVRKSRGKVFPWNFEEKVDVKASSEAFIQKMVRDCTYLQGETGLPKESLLYEKYMVLNELNNLKVNGVPIDVELKQNIYLDLFTHHKKVTEKKIRDYLITNGAVAKNIPTELSGIDGDFKSSLRSRIIFQDIFETETLTFEQEQMAEKIVFWSTIYGDSKPFLKERIEEHFGGKLSEKQIKRICGLRFRDWGRLSKAFLQLEGADIETGEIKTIIERMWDENLNLMECLSGRFTYIQEIREQGASINKSFHEFRYEDLEDLYVSAPVRRMIWQTILVVREITKVMGCPPDKIFVEMARDPGDKNEKVRKDSRKKKLFDLYKNCKGERDWCKEIDSIEEARFRSKKLYLYYTQMGRCMYTGEPIDLEDLFNDNLYDIDHIYPRHFVKDDSIEKNLVLVKKQVNSHKSDTFPIEKEIRVAQSNWWRQLCDLQLITKEKYERLMRNTEFSEAEMAAFISRQIVETRQGTKVITTLFENSFPETDVIYTKASTVSDFRHKYGLLKCREVNNLHHANDAYLNIVVGNVYNTKFTNNPINFIKEYQRDPEKYKYHMDRLFDFTVVRGDQIAWVAKGGESIRTVRTTMAKNTPLVTRMNYEAHGQLWDVQICSAKDAEKAKGVGYIPIKTTDRKLHDVMRYGGYRKYTGGYFFLVEHVVKGNTIRTIETMPIYLKRNLDTKEKMETYCRDVLNLEEPHIRVERIKMYSLIKVNGFPMYLTGRTGNRLVVVNAAELKLSKEWMTYIKRIFSSADEGEQAEGGLNYITRDKNVELYDILMVKHCKGIYSKRPNPVGAKLSEWRITFQKLSVDRQIYVLKQILMLSSNTNQGSDLHDLGGASKTGVSLLSKKVNDYQEFKLISQSPTGIFETERDLLTV